MAAARLNTSSFSSCLLVATSDGLVIGDIKDIAKMHIFSVSTGDRILFLLFMIWWQIPLGFDNPRRISYHAALKMYGIACVRTEPVRLGDPELITSSFRIMDDVSFSRKHWGSLPSLGSLSAHECRRRTWAV
jgi:DNA damage-binding protein 1